MKINILDLFGVVMVAALSSLSVSAASTNTWVGNTDVNWNTSANWTFSSGSGPVANGDSLVFGAAGSSGLTLNNNISGLVINNLAINGPAAFIFGGNAITLSGTLTNAASANETFSSGIQIGSGAAASICNIGNGTLALGPVTQAASPGGTVNFTNASTGAITTTSPNINGILGGWATVNSSGDFAATNGSGGIVAASYTTSGTPSGDWSATNYNGSFTLAANTTLNSLKHTVNDITVNAGVTLTLGSGGLILSGAEKWFKAGSLTTSILKSGLANGELYIHATNAAFANGWQIQPVIQDGAVATAVIKDGNGQVELGNANSTFSGGLYLNAGRVYLGANSTGGNGSAVTSGPLGTGPVTFNGGTLVLGGKTVNTTTSAGFTEGNNIVVPAGVSAVIDSYGGNGGFNGNLSGSGILILTNSSSTALSWSIGSSVDWSGFTGIINYNCGNAAVVFNIQGGSGNLDLSHAAVNINYAGTANSSWRTVSGFTTKFGSLSGNSGAANANIQNAGTIEIGNLNTDTTFAGFITGAGGITKVGTGKLTFSGTNTYTGATAVNAGIFQLGDGISANGTVGGNIALSDSSTKLMFANPNVQTYSGQVTGAGTLVKTGNGTLTLSGQSSYGGSTIVSNGTVIYTGVQYISGGDVLSVKDGATLGVAASSDSTYLAPGSLTIGSSSGATLQFGVYSTSVTAITPANPVTINGTATINISSCPFVNGASYPLFSGYTSGAYVLGSQPGGILGQLVNNSGTITYQVTNLVVDVWTAAVNTNWDIVTANWTNNIAGNLFASGYPVQFDDSANGASPLLVMITNTVAPGPITVSNVAKSYIIGGSAIAGSAGLTKAGSEKLTLTNVNTFTGALTISAGTVEIGGAGQLGSGTYAAAIADDGALIHNSTAAQTLSGAISGSGTLIKTNSGNLTLSGANSFGGGFTLNAGNVTIGSDSALGGGPVTLSGGSLNANATRTINNPVVVTAGTTNYLSQPVANGANVVLAGSLTGSGVITNAAAASGNAASIIFYGDLSGFQGSFVYQNYQSVLNFRFGPNTGSTASPLVATVDASQAKFVINTNGTPARPVALTDNMSGSVLKIGELSGDGVMAGSFQGSGTQVANTYEIGYLNTDSTFAGSLAQTATLANSTSERNFGIVKAGTGSLTLNSALSGYTGLTVVRNGKLIVGAPVTAGSAGPLGTASTSILVGDGASISGNLNPAFLIGGAFIVNRAITVGTNSFASSGTFTIGGNTANSAVFSGAVTLNQSVTVTQAVGGALVLSGPVSGNGGLSKVGNSILTLSGTNTYIGATTVGAGTLLLANSNSVSGSTNINVAGGATLDVSATSFSLGSQTLSGSGTVTGAVTSVSSGSSIAAGGVGTVGILTFKNDLNLSAGGSPAFDLSTSHLSGNDQVVVSGNLTINSSDTIHVKALSGAANLDTTGDYVLFSVAGTLSLPSQPALIFDGTPPANAGNFSVKSNGNNVVLRYSAVTSPVITGVTVTNINDGLPQAVRGQTVTVYVAVTPGLGTITNVSADLSPIGGSASQALTALGGNDYSYTLAVSAGTTLGSKTINVTTTDTTPLQGLSSANITINASTETWNGLASDDNWSSGNNWVSTFPPGYSGDALIFTGSTRTTPNMENDYNVNSLIFDGSASSFTIGAGAGKTLTLAGGMTNQSGSAQTLNVPIILNGTQTIADQGAGLALGGNISGAGGLTTGSGNVTLGGANTYAGDTIIAGGTLKVANSSAIPSGAGAGNVTVSGTGTGVLDLNGTNATINGLSGTSGAQILNNGPSIGTLTIGANDQAGTWSGYIGDGSSPTALAKVGTNILTLSTANYHSGGVTLNNGSLVYQNGGVFGSGTLTLAGGNLVKSGAAITVPNAINVTGSANFAGTAGGDPVFTGPLTGSGTFAVSNLAVGGITVQAVSLKLEGDLSGFTGTFSHTTAGVAGGGNRLRLSGANLGSVVIDCSQARLMTFGSTSLGNPVDLGDNTYGTLKLGELSGSGGILRGGWATAGNTTFEIGALNTSTTYSGAILDNINGSGGLSGVTKVGTGALTLNGPNSYTGPTTVSAGTLNVYSTKIGAGAFTVADGATLGVASVGAGSLAVTSLTLGNGSTNSFSGVSSTVVAVVTNAGALTLNGTVTVNIQGSFSVGQYPLIGSAGGITGAGGFVLGSIPLGMGANIITNGNTIVLNVTTAPVVQLWTGNVSTNWDFATTNWSVGGNPELYSDALSATFDDTASRTNVNLATNIAPNLIVVTNSTKNYAFSSAGGYKITGGSSLTKIGNGVLTLLGMSNDFTGTFVIGGGTVVIDGNGNLGGGSVNLQGVLSPVQSFTLTKTVALGPVSGTGTGTLNVGAGLVLTNNTVIVNYGSGTGVLVKSGAGTLQLGATNTYSGGTVVSNGTLVLTAGGQAGTIRSNLTVNAGATVTCVAGNALGWGAGTRVEQAYVSGLLQTIATNDDTGWNLTYNLTGGELRSNGGVSTTNATDGRFVLGGTCGVNTFASAGSSVISGRLNTRSDGGLTTVVFNIADGVADTDLLVSAAVTGGPGITKQGAGTMLMTGQNTYTGATTVSNGILLVNGSLASAVTVSGGTFGGTGTIGNAVTVNSGGTLSPGAAAIGTLTVSGNLTLAGNTLVKLNKSIAQSNDIVNVSGTLAYGGTLTVNNLGPALVAGDSFRIFPAGGTGSVTVAGSAGSGLAFSFNDGLLSVVTAGPSGPGTITNSISGSTLTLTWPAGQGWRLEAQTNTISAGLSPTGWNTASGAADGSISITINPANPTVFYRLVYP